MLDLRIYRAAFIPLVLALVVVAFSLQPRPRPITTTLPPDAFDGARAARLLDDLSTRFPQRRPGSAADRRLADVAEQTFRTTGFEVSTRDLEAQTIDGERTLRTVVGQRPGRVSRALVVVAHRDAAGSPARAELSGTATLLELARLFAGRTTRRTLVLVSTSGGSGGGAGAADWARHVRGPVDAVIVLGDMAGTRERRPQVVGWSNASGIAPRQLIRSAEQAVREEVGRGAGTTRTTMQALRLAFPLTVSEQGAVAAHGLPAVLLSASGELGPGPRDPVSRGALEGMGRAVLRTITALDEGPEVRPDGPRAVVLVRNLELPLWAVRLLAGVLLLPPLLAGLDALFRVRRRREAVLPWLGWALVLGGPFLATGLVLTLLRALGLVTAPGAPVAPGAIAVASGALVAAAAVLVLGFLLAWPAIARRTRGAGSGGAGIAAALLGVGLAWLVWLRNPYAALFLVPATHLWLLAVAPEVRVGRWLRAALVLVALTPFALALAAYGVALDAGPVALGWMGVLLVAGGHVGPISLIVWSAVAGTAVAALVAALATGRADDAPARGQLRSRGPIGYAGPGSLGGTDSALRR